MPFLPGPSTLPVHSMPTTKFPFAQAPFDAYRSQVQGGTLLLVQPVVSTQVPPAPDGTDAERWEGAEGRGAAEGLGREARRSASKSGTATGRRMGRSTRWLPASATVRGRIVVHRRTSYVRNAASVIFARPFNLAGPFHADYEVSVCTGTVRCVQVTGPTVDIIVAPARGVDTSSTCSVRRGILPERTEVWKGRGGGGGGRGGGGGGSGGGGGGGGGGER